jgi:hypothetical protein
MLLSGAGLGKRENGREKAFTPYYLGRTKVEYQISERAEK